MTNEDLSPREERMKDVTGKAFVLATACLTVVMVMMGVGLVLSLIVADNAQDYQERLETELACRGNVEADMAQAEANVLASVAGALVALSREEDLLVYEDEADALITELKKQSARRASAVDICQE